MTTESGVTSQNEGAPLDKTTAKAKAPGRDPHITERDQLLARMDEQIEARRKQENEEFLRSSDVDPAAWIMHQKMQAEAKTEVEPPADEAEPLEDGTEFVEPVAPVAAAPKAPKPAERISTKGEDPLGQYIVRVDGKPMIKTIVYGQERLVPLETARAELQKIGAGDERLRQAAELQKKLDARAAQLQKTEAELAARSRPTATALVDDQALDKEAVELVRSLVTDTEDRAAARLAKTLKTIRQAQQPQVDVDAITKHAADVATQRLVERETNRAMQDGFKTFTGTYRDIASDPELFAIADRKTDAIAAEHPEWSPGEVMLEAGRLTREWLTGMGVKPPAGNVPNQPSNRQQRKEALRPMPTPRSARPTAVTSDDGDGRQSTADIVAEIRKSRGSAS